jgi:hypothetical protein
MNNLFNSKRAEISIYGIISFLIVVVFLVAFTPAFNSIFGMSKDSQHFNCPGYDSDNSGTVGDNFYDYNASLNSDTMACVGSSYGLGLLAIIVIFGGAAFLITRGSGNENPVSSQY